MSVTQQQVVSLLENVLFESSTLAAANEASWAANPAATDIASLATAMAASPEESIAAHIVGYYLTALGRAPTGAEVQFYVSYAEKGLTGAQIAAGQVAASTWTNIASFFTNSPEFAAHVGLDYSLGATAAMLEAVPMLFEAVLGRAPSGTEISFYDNAVVSGAGLNTLLGYFTSSKEFATDTASQIATTLADFGISIADGGHPTLVGANVTLGPPAPPSPPPVTAASFGTLTAGTDTINDSAMSGAHTYQAILGAGATLNTNDSLTGNGLATLAITDNGTGGNVTLPAAPLTLSGIQTITLTTGEDFGSGGSFFNVSGVSGLTALNATATGTGTDSVLAGSNLAVTASTHGTDFMLVAAGSSTGITLALTDPALTVLTVNAGVLGGDINSVTVASAVAETSLDLEVRSVSSLSFTDSGNHITTLSINDPAHSDTISAISDSALTSLSVTGISIILGSSGSPITLGTHVATLDLSADTDTSGTNYFTVNSNNIAITLGTDNNVIDLNSKTGATITPGLDTAYSSGSPAPNVILEHVAAGGTTTINLPASAIFANNSASTLPQLITDAAAEVGAHSGTPFVLWDDFGGSDVYIVAATNSTPASGNLWIMKIVGGASIEGDINWTGGASFTV